MAAQFPPQSTMPPAGSITGSQLANGLLKFHGSLGRAGAGAISVTGLAINDRVFGVLKFNGSTFADCSADFESKITVNGQIQQTAATDYSSTPLIFLVVNGDPTLLANTIIGPMLALGAIKFLGIVGHNGAGAATCTGARVGDRVAGLIISNGTPFADGRSSFASTITVDDQITQSSATDLSSAVICVLLLGAT